MSKSDVKFACSVLRKADNDSKKLAALLIVGKLFAERSIDESDKSKIIKLIEYDFLLRLLNDYHGKLLVPMIDDGDNDNTSFCLDILVHFVSNIVQEYEYCERFAEILGQILLVHCTETELAIYDEHVVDNVLICFQCFNTYLNCQSETQINHLIEAYVNHVTKSYLLNVRNNNFKIETVLIHFSEHLEQQHFDKFLNSICGILSSYQTMEKFKLCQLIKSLLRSKTHVKFSGTTHWSRHIYTALFEILKNRLSDQMRNDALGLATQITITFNGFDWIKQTSWNEDNSKHFILLLRLVCIEMQLLITNYYGMGNNDNEKFGTFLILLEHLILAFVSNLDEEKIDKKDQLQIGSETIFSSIKAIEETMSKVIEFIKVVAQDELNEINVDTQNIIFGLIRLLCIYLNEETEALRNELGNILPFIISLFMDKNLNKNVLLQSIKPQVMSTIEQLSEDEILGEIVKKSTNQYK